MFALLCFVLAVLVSPFKARSRLEAENAVVPAQKYVRPGKRATDDGEWQFFVRRIESRARLPPSHRGWAVVPLRSSGAFVERNKPRRRNRRTFTAATRG